MLRDILESTAQQANERIALGSVLFTVRVDPSVTIPEWGLGGFTLSGREIEIVVDDNFSDLDQAIQQNLSQIAAHEHHHVVRWRGKGALLHFSRGTCVRGSGRSLCARTGWRCSTTMDPSLPRRANPRDDRTGRPEFDQGFDFGAWYFGIATDLPRWTG